MTSVTEHIFPHERSWFFLTLFPWGVFYGFGVGFAFRDGYPVLAIIAIFLLLRNCIYKNADHLFTRTFIKDNTGAYLDAGFYRFRLDTERCFLRIEEETRSKYGSMTTVLVLVRDEPQWWRRLFKNKIKLTSGPKPGEILELADKLDLKYSSFVSIWR